MNHFYKRFLLPVGLLSGAIIGAGVFALPFIFQKVGLITGFFYLFVGVALYAFLHLLYADTILNTPGDHRFVGYARIYLGSFAGRVATLITIAGMVFTLTVYLVLSVSFSNLIFSGVPLMKLLLFWAVASLAVFFNIKRLAFSEFVIPLAKLLIVGLLFVLGIQAFFKESVAVQFPADLRMLLFPLAPILFAMSGRVAIPTLVKYFRISHDTHDYPAMRRAIMWGTALPILVYALFVFGILGLSPEVSEDAVTGLSLSLAPSLLTLVGLLGLLSLWGSYIAVGVDAIASLSYDFRIPRAIRSSLVVGLPLVFYLVGFTSFLGLVGFVGGVFLGLEGIFILLLWTRAHKKGESLLLKNAHPLAVVSGFILLAAALTYESFMFLL